MSPAHSLGRLVIGAVMITGWVVWWAPSAALWVARWAGLYVFQAAELALVDLLFAVRHDRAARRVLAASIRRNRVALRAARHRLREAGARRG